MSAALDLTKESTTASPREKAAGYDAVVVYQRGFVVHADVPPPADHVLHHGDLFTVVAHFGGDMCRFEDLFRLASSASLAGAELPTRTSSLRLDGMRSDVTRLVPERCRPTTVGDLVADETLSEIWLVEVNRLVRVTEERVLMSLRHQPRQLVKDAFTDDYGNKVSIAHLGANRRANIVHHVAGRSRSHSTAYRRRGVSLKVRQHYPDHPCAVSTLDVGGYLLSWGDGELLRIHSPSGLPDLTYLSSVCAHQDFDLALIVVLGALWDVDAAWTHKELLPKRLPAAVA